MVLFTTFILLHIIFSTFSLRHDYKVGLEKIMAFMEDYPLEQLTGTEFPHTDQVWQVIRLQNIPYEKYLLTESVIQMQDRNKKLLVFPKLSL